MDWDTPSLLRLHGKTLEFAQRGSAGAQEAVQWVGSTVGDQWLLAST